MATTFVDYTGDGNATKSFSFPSYKVEDIKVDVDGVLKTVSTHYNITSYTTTGGGNVVFTSGNIPASPADIHIYRDTDVDSAKATYQAGSSVKAGDLNNNHTQLLYALQEEQNQPVRVGKIKDDAVIRSKILNDAIDGTKIADDSINSEHYVADSIDSEHYAPSSVDSAAIGASQVTTSELATDSVNTTKIINLNVTRDKIANDAINGTKIADDSINSEHYVDASIDHQHLSNDCIDGDNIQNDVVNSEHFVAGSIDNEHYAAGSITSDKLNAATVITSGEQGAATTNDTSFLTSAAADARFFNISSGDTIKDGQTFPDNDTTIATTAAINDRIIDLVDDVGGFVPIANETSFPTANPDVNNGAGTIVSVSALSSAITTRSGVTTATIANGAGTGNTVTITGLTASTTYPAGFGLLVETTSTLHTYTFHRLLPKATEVETVAGSIGNVNTTATNIANVNTVATNISNVNTVATDIANVNTVAGINANVTTVAGNTTNVNTVATNDTNITTVAGSIANVNTAATNIASINNASANITAVNNFGDTYQVASSNPSTDGGGNAVAEGDLYFNTSANRLKVYDGTNWVDGVIASGGGAQTTGDTFTGDLKLNDNVNLIVGTGDDLKLYHDGNDSYIDDAGTGSLNIRTTSSSNVTIKSTNDVMAKFKTADAVELYYNNSKKVETNTSGIGVTGNITVSGNVDGRDLAADGGKLDTYEANGSSYLRSDAADIKSSGDLTFNDNIKALFGTGSDLEIVHDGNNSVIQNNTGGIYVKGLAGGGNAVYMQPKNNENSAIFHPDGAVELYHNNVKKFETTSGGASVTGTLGVSNALNVSGLTTLSDSLLMGDNVRAKFGAGSDLQIHHDGTNSTILNQTGDLRIRNAGPLYITKSSTENMIIAIPDGSVELYYNNAIKAKTSNTGIQVSGNYVCSDNHKLQLGNAADLEIFHDGTGCNIRSTSSKLEIRSPDLILQNSSAEKYFRGTSDGAVELFYDNVEKFRTNPSGIKVSGNIACDGDNQKLILGAGDDLQIYHDGQKSIINDVGTGHLEINTNNLRVQNAAANETLIYASQDGSVDLYHNNSRRVETTSEGVTVNGPSGYSKIRFDTNGSHRGSIYFNNSNVGGFLDESGNWAANFDRGSNSFLYSNWMPSSDSYDLGSSSYRWGEVHAVNFYGNGSNLTGVDPTIADGCIYENNQTISSTVSTSSSKNSFAAGDINITGTLTVADNTNFVII